MTVEEYALMMLRAYGEKRTAADRTLQIAVDEQNARRAELKARLNGRPATMRDYFPNGTNHYEG